ncbi:MAG: DUF512 domain-containing protein [Clostridia bacterium]|nr:DUF512 domain-containing protein [Clostridia bacterium]
MVRIASVDSGSLAEEAGIQVGDELLAVNGTEIHDYLDYMYASCQEEAELLLKDRVVTILNEDYMPLGIGFESLLIDEPRSCHNKCIFCFIDQLPRGMRETCYFKDDDYRLSFLQGNYVSLTNMTQADVDRIIRYHLPRINISVHTMSPDLRVKMLHNKRAGEVLDYLRQFTESGLLVNAQIVLCPDWNDGEELDFTLQKLGELGENIESISVVPVGMTDHREGLETLRGFDKESSHQVLNQLERWQQKFLDTLGTRLVYAGDEFYLMAELPFPDYEAYEDFPQIENGVGLCASLLWEFEQALSDTRKRRPKKKKTMATGKSVYPFMQTLIGNLEGDRIGIYPIENRFFGEKITVTGLITGQDLIAQLQGKELGEELLISSAMLRHDGDMFLDNTTLEEVEKVLGIKVRTVRNDGYELLDALLK